MVCKKKIMIILQMILGMHMDIVFCKKVERIKKVKSCHD